MVFLVVLFLLKNGLLFDSITSFMQSKQTNGITYDNNMTVKDLINKDTDGDGVPDWEEILYGLDPTKKETTPGIPDSVALEKMKADQTPGAETANGNNQDTQNLTKTDQFSKELLSTVAALDMGGSMDQSTVDQISSSLANEIQNSTPRKVFSLSDIKVINDNSLKAIKKYSDTLNAISKKYPDRENVMDVLQKFIADGNNVDSSALLELDPIIAETQGALGEILKMSVPQSLTSLHLDFINAGEKLIENMSDMKLFDTDPVVAFGAMSQYESNANSFQSALIALASAVGQKLNS